MKHLRQPIFTLLAGMALGSMLLGNSSASGITAEPSRQPIYVDGRQVSMTAYNIGGSNYVKLRDIGQAVGFNVYWDDGVQVDSGAPYTGEAPARESSAVRREIVSLTNAFRAERGLEALAADQLLMQAAQVRAEELAASATYAHTRPDGSHYSTVTDCKYVGENLHRVSFSYLEWKGRGAAEYAVESWAGSQEHLRNMVNSQAAAIGAGAAKGLNGSGEECWYLVQLFLLDGCRITWVDAPIAAQA